MWGIIRALPRFGTKLSLADLFLRRCDVETHIRFNFDKDPQKIDKRSINQTLRGKK